MAKVYIRALPILPTNTLTLTASANDFITNATNAAPNGGGLSAVNDIDVEFYNGIMFVIMKELDP